MDIHGVAKRRTWQSDFHFHFHVILFPNPPSSWVFSSSYSCPIFLLKQNINSFQTTKYYTKIWKFFTQYYFPSNSSHFILIYSVDLLSTKIEYVRASIAQAPPPPPTPRNNSFSSVGAHSHNSFVSFITLKCTCMLINAWSELDLFQHKIKIFIKFWLLLYYSQITLVNIS